MPLAESVHARAVSESVLVRKWLGPELDGDPVSRWYLRVPGGDPRDVVQVVSRQVERSLHYSAPPSPEQVVADVRAVLASFGARHGSAHSPA